MRRKWRVCGKLFLILALVVTSACASVQAGAPLKLSKNKLEMKVGVSKKISIKHLSKKSKVKWKSSKASVATVSRQGIVKAKKAGRAKILAVFSFGGKKKTLTCTVTVKQKKNVVATPTVTPVPVATQMPTAIVTPAPTAVVSPTPLPKKKVNIKCYVVGFYDENTPYDETPYYSEKTVGDSLPAVGNLCDSSPLISNNMYGDKVEQWKAVGTFSDWYLDAGCTGKSFTTVPYTEADTLNLYQKFTPNTFSLSYDLRGGKLDAEFPKEYTFRRIVNLPTACKEHYEFGGWHIDCKWQPVLTGGITAYEHIDGAFAGDAACYALWLPERYTATFVSDIDGIEDRQEYPHYYAEPDAKTTYLNFTTTDITSWKEVELNPAVLLTSIEMFNGWTEDFVIPEGYMLEGWYDNPEFTGDPVTRVAPGSTGAVTFYGKYSKINK